MLKRWSELYNDDIKAVNQEIRMQEGRNAKCIYLKGGYDFRYNFSLFTTYIEKCHNTHVLVEKRALKLCEFRILLDCWVLMLTSNFAAAACLVWI